MKYAMKAGMVLRTPIYLHISLLLVLPFYAVVFGFVFFDLFGFPIGFGDSSYDIVGKIVFGALLAAFLYVAILIHELGHVWAAWHKGYQVTNVTLIFVGGVSEMEHPKDWPRGEAEVALSGALISITLGGLLLSSYFLLADVIDGWKEPLAAVVLSGFGLFNFFLGAMNILPILPMDGGMILRDILRYDLGMAKASAMTVMISRVVALLMVAIGIFLLSWIIFLVGLVLLLTISPRQLES